MLRCQSRSWKPGDRVHVAKLILDICKEPAPRLGLKDVSQGDTHCKLTFLMQAWDLGIHCSMKGSGVLDHNCMQVGLPGAKTGAGAGASGKE